jgi:hypothetical protein
MSFGNSPSAPSPPPVPPPPPPIADDDFEADLANVNLLARKRRGRGSLVVNPSTTGQVAGTGLFVGGAQ